jgi:hypothetical protein
MASFGSLPVGATKAWSMFTDNAKGIVKIFTGEVKARKAISSPIGIAVMFGSHVDWIRFWSLVGFLSMVLALNKPVAYTRFRWRPYRFPYHRDDKRQTTKR